MYIHVHKQATYLSLGHVASYTGDQHVVLFLLTFDLCCQGDDNDGEYRWLCWSTGRLSAQARRWGELAAPCFVRGVLINRGVS